MKWIARLVAVLTFAVTESWGVGLIATDRWEWSQWLAWIPTQVTIAFIFIALVFCF